MAHIKPDHTCFDVALKDRIATVTLARPDALNSLIRAFWTELPEIVSTLDASGDVRAIVLASTGRHFTAGMDLSVFQEMPDLSAIEGARARAALAGNVRALQASFSALEAVRMPVIAAIQGGCIGGGVDMVCACDIRLCTEDAFFCIQETNLGLVADLGTYPRLAHLLPQGVVRELPFTGRRMAASEARDRGLVNAIYPDRDTILAAAEEMAREIAAKSPLAIWGTKEALNYGRDHGVAETLSHIALWQAGMFGDADLGKALAARGNGEAPEYDDLLPRDFSVL